MLLSFVVALYVVPHGFSTALALCVSLTAAELLTTIELDVADTTWNDPLLPAFVKPENCT
jgi:hypothetical protein